MNPENRRVGPPRRPSHDEVVEPPPSRGSLAPTVRTRLADSLRTAAGLVLVLGISFAVAWAARRHIMSSPRFAVTDVEVVGNDRRSADALVAESGLSVGGNIFSVDLEAARSRLLGDPWLAEAELARRLPGTLLIQVTERRAAAVVALGDTFLATAEGEPFKRLELGDPVDLPLVTGLRPESVLDDRDGSTRSIRRAIELASDYDRSALARHAPLQEVHLGAEGTFTLVVGRGATELVLGSPPFRRKLEQAERVFAELDKRGAKADRIMLDNEARPERVVVRMR